MICRLALLPLALSAPTLSAAPMVQSSIHHCVAADGTPVYTDQPCAQLHATPAPREPAPGVGTVPRTGAIGPRFCPVDRDTLKTRVARAFRSQDANALAGLMLWHGYGHGGARHTLRDLARLVRRPFIGFVDATDPVPAMSGLPPLVPPDERREDPHHLKLDLDDPAGPQVTFTIIERAGCLWLQP